jgi:hypothetical protein
MLLRRVIEHVREQNLTAIAIDFVIVVLGVFVGIQVSNWNTERTERERGSQFAERLRADLRQERWLYEFMIAYHSDVRDSARRAAAALEGREPLSNHDLLVEAYRATQYREGARRRATYDELVSTGSLGLIDDQSLLGTAAEVYRIRTIDNLVQESLQSPYRREFRMSLDSEVQRQLARACGDRYIRPGEYQGMGEVLGFPCQVDLPPEAIDAAAEGMRANAVLLRALRLRLSDLETRMSDFTGNNREVFKALREVAGDAP